MLKTGRYYTDLFCGRNISEIFRYRYTGRKEAGTHAGACTAKRTYSVWRCQYPALQQTGRTSVTKGRAWWYICQWNVSCLSAAGRKADTGTDGNLHAIDLQPAWPQYIRHFDLRQNIWRLEGNECPDQRTAYREVLSLHCDRISQWKDHADRLSDKRWKNK